MALPNEQAVKRQLTSDVWSLRSAKSLKKYYYPSCFPYLSFTILSQTRNSSSLLVKDTEELLVDTLSTNQLLSYQFVP